MALRLRRGTDAERLLITPLEGELIYTTDTKLLYAGDGSTAGGILVTGSGGGGSSTLNELTDTDLTGTADSDVLTFNGATNKWEASPVPGVGTISLADLDDVAILENPVNGDALTFDGLNFVPKPLSDLFQEQQNYKINIVGDDSTILVNTDTNEITGTLTGTLTGDVNGTDDQQLVDATERVFRGDTIGFHVGDVVNVLENKLLVNATLETFTGDLTGSVFGDDSTLLVDGVNGKIVGDVETDNVVNIYRSSGTGVKFHLRQGTTASPSAPNNFDRTGITWSSYTESTDTYDDHSLIYGYHQTAGGGYIALSPVSQDNSTFFETALELDGNAATMTVAAPNGTTFSGSIKPGVYADAAARDAAITSPSAGEIVFVTDVAKFQGYDGTSWTNLN